jgi:hypothetical protein
MTGVSYSTVRDYVAGRLPARQPAVRHLASTGDDARQATLLLRKLLGAMQPGTAARAQPHLDALDLVIKQTLNVTGADSHGRRSA